MIAELILFIVALCSLGYFWLKRTYSFFEKFGIEHDKPTLILGSNKDTLLQKANLVDHVETQYKSFNSNIVGIFDMVNPVFLLRSPELIRQVAIKDFDHFINRRPSFDASNGGLFGISLLHMQSQKWKDMRATLSPSYTGSKMRGMFELMKTNSEQAVNYMKSKLNEKETEIELKDLFSRYANDVIASTAFGLKINSFEGDNEFFKMGQVVTSFTTFETLKFFLISNFQTMSKYLCLKLFPKEQTDYFMRLVLDAMKQRKSQNIVRPDLINTLMEVKESGKWTDEEIVAQCFIFFFAGFDTVTLTLCCAAYEIMRDQDVQEKLRSEINEVVEFLDGSPLTYEALSKLKYLDAVLQETLRIWPQAPQVDRVCTKPTIIVDPYTGKTINLSVGDAVSIPIVGLQRDPKYFPEPMKFDPERFNDDNKKSIDSNTYMPFGIGPRMCIGMRFAQLEIKTILFYFLKEFKFERCSKSTVPLVLDPSTIQPEPKEGFWVKVLEC